MGTLPPMVLVAPRPLRPPHRGRRRRRRATRCWRCCGATPRRGRASTRAWPAGCGPGSRTRRTGWSASRGDLAPPLLLGPREVLGPDLGEVATRPAGRQASMAAGRAAPPTRSSSPGSSTHCSAGWSSTGTSIDDPLARRARRAARRGAGGRGDGGATSKRWTRRRGRRWATSWRATPRTCVDLVPRLAPGWMPRTDDRVAIPLAGGRVVLHGVFDLLVGLRPARARRRCARWVCAPAGRGPGSGAHCTIWRCSRRCAAGRRRSGWPCSRPGSGRYGIEDVREEHLRAVASHLAAWLAAVASAGRGSTARRGRGTEPKVTDVTDGADSAWPRSTARSPSTPAPGAPTLDEVQAGAGGAGRARGPGRGRSG